MKTYELIDLYHLSLESGKNHWGVYSLELITIAKEQMHNYFTS